MRGFYLSACLLLMLTPTLQAQSLCADLRISERLHEADLLDDNALHADAGLVDLQAYGISTLKQGVRLRFGRQLLMADDVLYEHATQHLRVDGKTFFESDELQIEAGGANLQLGDESALFKDARYVAYAAGARGEAGELEISGRGQAALRDVRYTTCPAGQEDWVLEGDEIRLDNNRGMGSAKNARLRFKGVPLFWLPRFYFPVGDARRSGLLPPRLGDSDATGLDISLPFYINLAPNYDLTLTPRHMSTRGDMLAAELRYLWSHSEGRSQIEYLDKDEVLRDDRYLLRSELQGGDGQRWIWQADLITLSDAQYLTEIGSREADQAESQLPRELSLSYFHLARGLSARLAARNYQSLLPSLRQDEVAYAREPELRLQWTPPVENGSIQPQIRFSTVNFRRDESTEGLRSDAQLGLSWQRNEPQGYVGSTVAYRVTNYQLSSANNTRSELTRTLPRLSLQGGLNFIRTSEQGRHQTLSPQLFYLYVPYKDQGDIPLFDTSEPDFSFDQLFALNRYTGIDRISDANVLTTAIRSDWYSDNGRMRELTAKLGVQWRMESARVTLPGESPQQAGSSDWIGELDYALSELLRAQAIGQWDADEKQIDQGSLALRYRDTASRVAQVSYRFRRDNFEQSDILLSVPLTASWRVAGRWTYSLEDQRTLDALAGLEYKSCCWGTQVVWRRRQLGNEGSVDSSIFLQLELNGLGRIGEGLNTLLERDIL